MKTEQEIKEEIKVTKVSKEKFVEAFKDGRIDKETLEYKLQQYETRLLVLNWVLDEND
jgi:hypothetical protein